MIWKTVLGLPILLASNNQIVLKLSRQQLKIPTISCVASHFLVLPQNKFLVSFTESTITAYIVCTAQCISKGSIFTLCITIICFHSQASSLLGVEDQTACLVQTQLPQEKSSKSMVDGTSSPNSIYDELFEVSGIKVVFTIHYGTMEHIALYPMTMCKISFVYVSFMVVDLFLLPNWSHSIAKYNFTSVGVMAQPCIMDWSTYLCRMYSACYCCLYVMCMQS